MCVLFLFFSFFWGGFGFLLENDSTGKDRKWSSVSLLCSFSYEAGKLARDLCWAT